MSFLIVHGWQNHRPEGHWQRWLAGRLADGGSEVRYPKFPQPDEPVPGDWSALLRSELAALGSDGERVLVCHSLAVLLWWQSAATLGELQPDRVLLVAPPSADVLRGYPEVAAFAPPGIETTSPGADVLARVRLVAADDDPYFPGGAGEPYAALGIDVDVIPGGGHLDLPAGYGSWPSVLAWCTDPSVRLTAR